MVISEDEKKIIGSYFRGTEKTIEENRVFEGTFHFDPPKAKCIEELKTGEIELRVIIPHSFPIPPPRAYIKDEKLFVFPHLRMGDGQICPPDHNAWIKNASLEGFFKYLSEWLRDAAQENVSLPDDDYELPDFPIGSKLTFIFLKEKEEAEHWLLTKKSEIGVFFFEQEFLLLFLKQFKKTSSNLFQKGIYVWLPEEPIIRFKRPPITYAELDEILKKFDLSLYSILEVAIRNQIKEDFILIIGFPIKDKNKDPASDIHWQASNFLFTDLDKIKRKLVLRLKKSFRKKGIKKWREELKKRIKTTDFLSLAKDKYVTYLAAKPHKICYLNSVDCSEKYLYSRIGGQVKTKSFLLCGCGAIGSNLASQFAKAGCKEFSVCDYETIVPGNICRHYLNFDSVNESKASELVHVLKKINPWGNYKSYELNILEGFDERILKEFDSCEFWIDAGLPPGASECLSFWAKKLEKRLVSTYITIDAQFLILVISGKKSNPPIDALEKRLIESSREKKGSLEECVKLLENAVSTVKIKPNIGCYFLTFAATGAQMSQISAIVFDIINEVIEENKESGKILVYRYNKRSYIYEPIFNEEIKL